MPIYTFVCKDCKEKFDLLIGVTMDKPELKCKKCGSKNIERIISSFNVGESSKNTQTSSDSGCPGGVCPTCF